MVLQADREEVRRFVDKARERSATYRETAERTRREAAAALERPRLMGGRSECGVRLMAIDRDQRGRRTGLAVHGKKSRRGTRALLLSSRQL
jgi:hypothetical protein